MDAGTEAVILFGLREHCTRSFDCRVLILLLLFFRKGVRTLDFMNAVSTHTQVLENGLRELRYDLTANPLRTTVDVGTEAVILCGLRERCTRSFGCGVLMLIYILLG